MRQPASPSSARILHGVALVLTAACGSTSVGLAEQDEPAVSARTAEEEEAPAAFPPAVLDSQAPAAFELPVLDPQELAAMPWPDAAPPLVKAVVAGPWTPGVEGLSQAWFDESMRTVPISMQAGRRTWSGFTSHGNTLLLDTRYDSVRGPQAVCAFALLSYKLEVTPPAEPSPAIVHLEHRGQVRLLIDGRVVLEAPASPDGSAQRVRTVVMLEGPDDAFLLKCGRGSDALGTSMNVELRVTDLQGQPLPGQFWQTVRIRGDAEAPASVEAPPAG